MNYALKLFLILLGISALVIVGFFVYLNIIFDNLFTGPFYDKSDLIENYEERTEAIIDVKNYFKSILPDSARVDIEFENDNKLGIFHVRTDNNDQNNWNLRIKSHRVDSLLSELKWTTKQLETLKEKLDNANCISISGRNPVVIGWQRSGLGKFSYDIFDNNLKASQLEQYNNGCTYIYYKDNIVLEYGGGAIGSQCFAEFYQDKRKN